MKLHIILWDKKHQCEDFECICSVTTVSAQRVLNIFKSLSIDFRIYYLLNILLISYKHFYDHVKQVLLDKLFKSNISSVEIKLKVAC